jgi:UDPglucose 6-dehydrogenase
MKIVVVGLGYVGLSNAVLLALHNSVIGVDVSKERVDALNARQSSIVDVEMSEYLNKNELNLSASTDLKNSVQGADYVIVSTPTNYDEKTNFFDTSSVESVIEIVRESEPKSCIVVKSTIPVGFIDDVRARLETDAIFFSPEFLQEGRALHDNLYPSRIIVGDKSDRARVFAKLLKQGAVKEDLNVLFTGTREAEAIKLFSNTYLAMRVAFFNELDSYALVRDIDSREIIEGVSLDPRIGNYYNNPSFGYGGYCLPKDTKQLLANYDNIPQNIIRAIVDANATRKKFLVDIIVSQKPSIVGVYRLVMKAGSDNFRDSSMLGIISLLKDHGIKIIIYEPGLVGNEFLDFKTEQDFNIFVDSCDLIISNRMTHDLDGVKDKVYTRDLFGIH